VLVLRHMRTMLLHVHVVITCFTLHCTCRSTCGASQTPTLPLEHLAGRQCLRCATLATR
jgi:hypothetical protein